MKQTEGIKYIKDSNGYNRYLRIDLKRYPETQLIEDFLDALEVVYRKNEKTISLDEFNRYIDDKLKINV